MADCYSLGMVLWEILTGAVPFDEDGKPLFTAVGVSTHELPLPRLPALPSQILLPCKENERRLTFAFVWGKYLQAEFHLRLPGWCCRATDPPSRMTRRPSLQRY